MEKISALALESSGRELVRAVVNESMGDLSWENADVTSLSDIIAMMRSGAIMPSDLPGWESGASRTMTGKYGNNNVTYTFTLTDPGHYKLDDGSDCLFTVIMSVSTLKGPYYWLTYDDRQKAGNVYPCSTVANRFYWCENLPYYRLASIDKDFMSIFRNFVAPTMGLRATGSPLYRNSDLFTIPAEMEVFGTRTYSYQAEADVLTQLDYYKDPNNRKTMILRSPSVTGLMDTCQVSSKAASYLTLSGSTSDTTERSYQFIFCI